MLASSFFLGWATIAKCGAGENCTAVLQAAVDVRELEDPGERLHVGLDAVVAVLARLALAGRVPAEAGS